jgi:hypothetical protein
MAYWAVRAPGLHRKTARLLQPVDPNRPCNVLQFMFASVLEVYIELAAHLSVSIVRDANAARLGYSFKARSNIHTVPEYIVFLDDNVADMDANAEFNALVLRYRCIALGHTALYLNRTTRGIDRAHELN